MRIVPKIRFPVKAASLKNNNRRQRRAEGQCLGWTEAADLIIKGMDGAINAKTVTYDFARLMDGATEVRCSQFGDKIIRHM